MPEHSSPPPPSNPPLFRRVGAIPLRSIPRTIAGVFAGFAVLIAAGLFAAIHYPDSAISDPEPVDRVVYLDQGWGTALEADARQTYYYTPQGAGLKDLRYSWFVNLELPWGTKRFAEPDHLRRYGFIVDSRTEKNPDQLPVGFTKRFDRQLNEELLDVTCAACHTGQINITRDGHATALRIDGGQAMHAFTAANVGHFIPTMVASMTSTALNPIKFNRFARGVLGDRYPEGRWRLHRELRAVIATFAGISFNEWRRGLYPTAEGFGRTDALARIANTVFAENLDPANYAVGNGPVSFPPVWNIWKFDWVQYNSSVSQPMARNIGESMGVGAKYALVDAYGNPLPPEERFRSTTLVENLYTIERQIWKLQPPPWPEEFLGVIDRQKAARGKDLFNTHCVGCHGPHVASPALRARNAPLRGEDAPEWVMKTICLEDIGTDPNTAMNFVNATVDLGRTGLTADDLRRVARKSLQANKERETAYLTAEIARLKAQLNVPPGRAASPSADVQQRLSDLERELAGLDAWMEQQLAEIDPRRVSVGAGLSYLGTMIREKAYDDLHMTDEQRGDHDGFGTLDMPRVIAAYKPRPLAGAWATPPYLHNGSVPTLYDLLSPVAERPAKFMVGSREFDPARVGLVTKTTRGFEFDTSKPGNHNTGHEFNAGYVEFTEGGPPQKGIIGPLLTPDERMAIIEYLKVRNDDRDGPQASREAEWTSCPRVPQAPSAGYPRRP